jgi:GNAT superfamily N-acetyltransferase
MDLRIRKALRKDLPAVVALLAQMDGEPPLPLAAASRIHREMCKYPSYACYLALADGEPAGTFTLLVFPTLVHDGRCEALVDGVVVAPSLRGRGIGGAMMAEAMRLAAEAGCYKVALSSNTKREDAHRFYRSLGFRQHGVSFWIDIVPLGDAQKAVRDLVSAGG